MNKFILIVVTAVFLTSCSSDSGPAPSSDFEVYRVNLDDGRVLECISSRTYGGSGVLDCNWDELE